MATINDSPQSSNPSLSVQSNRRVVIKKLAVGTAALTGCSLLPDRWTTPLIEFGALPAHATTSGFTEELVKAIEQAEAEIQGATASTTESATADSTDAQQEDAASSAAVESEWTTINWGGNPNASGDDRDRLWWTKIHGSSWPYWHRKFPLPRWLDDKSYQIDFVFSDGVEFYVPDSRQMAMDANGPKYKPEESGESDPDKQHPKIGVLLHTDPSWVKFRTY